MQCSNCTDEPHGILGPGEGGEPAPVCFILSDQCFPPALPAPDGHCMAIVRVEDGTLLDLTGAFLCLTRGCEVPVGSVALISSLNHLGRVGAAAYAEDFVAAVSEIRRAFGG